MCVCLNFVFIVKFIIKNEEPEWQLGVGLESQATSAILRWTAVSSDEGLDVALADSLVVESGSPVLAAEGLEEGAESLVEETAESHPEGIEVISDDPGSSEEARWLNQL